MDGYERHFSVVLPETSRPIMVRVGEGKVAGYGRRKTQG